VPKGIKVRHGMKTIEFYNEFHGSWWRVSTARWEPQEEGMMSTIASLPSVVKPRLIKLVRESQTSEGDTC
jgi:hypothetical protein